MLSLGIESRKLAKRRYRLIASSEFARFHENHGFGEAFQAFSAHRVVINDVGHLMYIEKPAEFSRTVIEFLENL